MGPGQKQTSMQANKQLFLLLEMPNEMQAKMNGLESQECQLRGGQVAGMGLFYSSSPLPSLGFGWNLGLMAGVPAAALTQEPSLPRAELEV